MHWTLDDVQALPEDVYWLLVELLNQKETQAPEWP